MSLLEGRVAIVTGAGRGVGRAVAHELARSGAKVLVNDAGTDLDGTGSSEQPSRDVVDEIERAGGGAVANCVDVTSEQRVSELLGACTEALGDPDILITCHGIVRDAALQATDERDLMDLFRVHVVGTALCIKGVAARMKRRSGGRIVVTTAAAGLLGNLGQSAYAAAAGAIHGFARSAAIELQRHGITVNMVAPLAKTRSTADLPMFEHVDSMTPEHVAPAYVFFASPLCADRTGHVLSAAGARLSLVGMNELPGQFKETDGGIWTPEEIAEHWPALARR